MDSINLVRSHLVTMEDLPQHQLLPGLGIKKGGVQVHGKIKHHHGGSTRHKVLLQGLIPVGL